MSESASELESLPGDDPAPSNFAIIIYSIGPRVKINMAMRARATHLAVHQHPSPPAPRLVKQVPGKLRRLPRAFSTEHCPAPRFSEHAIPHPMPSREQYLKHIG